MKQLLLAASLSISMLSFSQDYSRAKIFTNSQGLQQLAELGIAIDHGYIKQDTYFVSDFSAAEIQKVRDAGFEVEILIADVQQYYIDRNAETNEPTRNTTCPEQSGSNPLTPEVPANFNLGSMAGFYTYQQFLDELDAMAALYPNLITVRDSISNYLTIGNRPLWYVRMSDNPNSDETDETEVLYTAVHHAREPQSLSQTIFYMWYLLENYDNSEEIQFLLNHTELYFVPMVNPDGYLYNQTQFPGGGGLWRKNRRNNGGGDFGVDNNRNYSYGWGTTGVSMDPGSDTYPGTGAFSEVENQAIKWFCENHDFIFAFNAHTYANDILHPIGTSAAEFAADHDYFQAFTHHMVEYNGYAAIKSSDLYPASGDSDDYMYKMDTVIKPKIFAMTPEIGSDNDGFWPASANITPIAQEMVFPNMVLAHLSHKYLVVEDTDPSSIDLITGSFNHSAYRLGQENGPVTVLIEPLLNIQIIGSSVSHDLEIMESENGSISYELNPAIEFGDEVRYVLNTEYGLWTKRDTITKIFGTPASQFLDDASNSVNWTGDWSTTTSEFVSPTKSFTDSPTGDYQNNSTRTYQLNQVVDLTYALVARARFYAKWEIEPDYDYCQFQVSTDGGTTWQGQCGLYTNPGSTEDGVQPVGQPLYDGTQNTWVLEEIDLSDYLGQAINVRFIMKSDGGVRMDGFYFDDFELLYNLMPDAGLEENTIGMKSMPNPANTYAQIGFDQPVSAGRITVYNLSGQLIQTETIHSLTNKITLNTANWNEGMYTIVFSDGKYSAIPTKLVVVH